MTTKILDNKICTFNFFCRGVSHEKKQRFGRFSSLPPRPPSKSEHFIFIVVSLSLIACPAIFHSVLRLCRACLDLLLLVVGAFTFEPRLSVH